MTKYRVTRIDFGTIHDEPMITEQEVGIVSREQVLAMAKLPGWHMVEHEDGSLWLNCDGLGWERLRVGNTDTKG